MHIEFITADHQAGATAAVAVLVHEAGTLSSSAKVLDLASGGVLTRAVCGGRFTGAKGQTLDLIAPAGLDAARIVLIGAGAPQEAETIETRHIDVTEHDVKILLLEQRPGCFAILGGRNFVALAGHFFFDNES